MEEVTKMAMAYYQASSDDLQKLALGFFCAMDQDGDGKIDQREFMDFMRDEGYGQMSNSSFFNQLDLNKNGTLEFDEVMTIYYIVKSGRPFCDNCKKFITSTYLACVGCFEDPYGGSFHLCLDCYSKQNFNHTHDDICRFLDNYSLLETMMTNSKLNELRSLEADSKPNEGASSPPPVRNLILIENNNSFHYPPPPPPQYDVASTAIQPQRQNRWCLEHWTRQSRSVPLVVLFVRFYDKFGQKGMFSFMFLIRYACTIPR